MFSRAWEFPKEFASMMVGERSLAYYDEASLNCLEGVDAAPVACVAIYGR